MGLVPLRPYNRCYPFHILNNDCMVLLRRTVLGLLVRA